jgi:hypothetical protein
MTTPTKTTLAGELSTLTIGSAVGQLLSIDSISEKKAKVSTVALGDTVKTNRLSTMADVGDTKFSVTYDPANHATLQGWLDATGTGVTQTVVIAMSTVGATTATATYTNAAGYCTDWSIAGIKEDGNITLDITVAFNAEWVKS